MSQEEKLTVIEGTTLIDGTGHPPLSNALVVVRGKRIDAVGVKGIVKIPPDADRVDGAGKWLLPGLIDLHVHLWNPGFVSHSIRGSQVAYGTILAAANDRATTLLCRNRPVHDWWTRCYGHTGHKSRS